MEARRSGAADPCADPKSAAVELALGEMLGARISVSARPLAGRVPRLHPREEPFVAGFHPTRAREFSHGRALVRELLPRFGVAPAPVAIGPHREPIWPAGIVGSISHAAGLCAVALADAKEFAAIGLDVEGAEPLDADLSSFVAHTDESTGIAAALGCDPGAAAKVVFAAKEAFYKAQFPLTGRFLEFRDVGVGPRCDGSFDFHVHAPEVAGVLEAFSIRLSTRTVGGVVLAACTAESR